MKWVGGWSFVFCLFCYLVLVFFLVCFKVLRVMHSIILLEQWLVILIQAIPFDTLDTPWLLYTACRIPCHALSVILHCWRWFVLSASYLIYHLSDSWGPRPWSALKDQGEHARLPINYYSLITIIKDRGIINHYTQEKQSKKSFLIVQYICWLYCTVRITLYLNSSYLLQRRVRTNEDRIRNLPVLYSTRLFSSLTRDRTWVVATYLPKLTVAPSKISRMHEHLAMVMTIVGSS